MIDSSHKISRTVQSARQEAAEALAGGGVGHPRLEAEILIKHILNVRKEELILHPQRELTEPQEEQFQQMIHRRLRREPIAYITGCKEFWSLDFEVSPKVLIPRPETEGIIERQIQIAGPENRNRPLQILDVGTGSGILAVVSALEFPEAQVTAIDVSEDALNVARTNARKHHVADRIEWLAMDMKKPWSFQTVGGFDFILSNPPYIPSQILDDLMPDVRDYEPRSALDGGPDGLMFIGTILPQTVHHLKPGGSVIMEVGDDQAEAVKSLLQDNSCFENFTIIPDLSGRGRILSARRTLG